MLIGTHIIVGSVAGLALDNPLGALFLGLISHLLLDTIPHFDTVDDNIFTKRQITIVAAELIVAILLIYSLVWRHTGLTAPIILGSIGGFLPDCLDNVPVLKDYFRRTKFGALFHYWHERWHRKQKVISIAILTQSFIAALFLYLGYLVK